MVNSQYFAVYDVDMRTEQSLKCWYAKCETGFKMLGSRSSDLITYTLSGETLSGESDEFSEK